MKAFNPRNKIHFQTKQFIFYIKNLKKKQKKKWIAIKKINKGLFGFNKFNNKFNIKYRFSNRFSNRLNNIFNNSKFNKKYIKPFRLKKINKNYDQVVDSYSFNKFKRSCKFIKFIKFIKHNKKFNKNINITDKEFNKFIKSIKLKNFFKINNKKPIQFNKKFNNKFNNFYNKSKKYKKFIYYKKKHLYKIFYFLKYKYKNLKLKKKNINTRDLILFLYFKKKIKNFIKFLLKHKYYKNKKKIFIQKKKFLKTKKKIKKYSIKLLFFLKNNKNFFKTTLHLKQLIKNFNGRITTKKFKKIFKNYFLIKNKYNINFCIFLDSSIDNYLVKTGLAKSIYEARQLIIHNKVTINNVLIKSCFIFLKPGDIFNLKCKNRPIKLRLPINIIYSKFLKNFIFMRYKNINEIYYPFNIDTHLLEYSLKK